MREYKIEVVRKEFPWLELAEIDLEKVDAFAVRHLLPQDLDRCPYSVSNDSSVGSWEENLLYFAVYHKNGEEWKVVKLDAARTSHGPRGTVEEEADVIADQLTRLDLGVPEFVVEYVYNDTGGEQWRSLVIIKTKKADWFKV